MCKVIASYGHNGPSVGSKLKRMMCFRLLRPGPCKDGYVITNVLTFASVNSSTACQLPIGRYKMPTRSIFTVFCHYHALIILLCDVYHKLHQKSVILLIFSTFRFRINRRHLVLMAINTSGHTLPLAYLS